MNDKTLTVGELISKLQQFNPAASVYMCVNGHVTRRKITSCTSIHIFRKHR